jgi:hypothetical protein
VLDSKTVAFPCYDGNGMFYSMGNLLGNPQVGMLFVNFEKPHRLRLQGIARVDDIQAALSAKDRARVEQEGGLISRAEYEKYINDV